MLSKLNYFKRKEEHNVYKNVFLTVLNLRA